MTQSDDPPVFPGFTLESLPQLPASQATREQQYQALARIGSHLGLQDAADVLLWVLRAEAIAPPFVPKTLAYTNLHPWP